MVSLPFLKSTAQGELVLRVQRACESEHKQHRQDRANLLQGCIDRGLKGSTVYTSAFVDAEVAHFRRLASILREQIFVMAEAENVSLSDCDEKAISEHLKIALESNRRQLETELEGEEKRLGVPVSLKRVVKQKMDEAIHLEAVAAVSIRVAELRRQQSSKRETRRLDLIEKLVLLVVGAAFGIGGSLLTQWLLKRAG